MRPPIDNFVPREFPKGDITQFFGKNPALYARFNLDGHNGIDIVAPWGTPIKATTRQRVVEVKNSPTGYGKHVRCIDDNFEYTYGHLSSIDCKVGDTLEERQILGKMGNTGFVVSGATPFWKYNPYAGTHLHFTIRRIGGVKWFSVYSSGDKVYIMNYDNGYKGAVNPTPYLKIENQEDVRKMQLTVISLANQIILLYKQLIGTYK